MATVIARNVTSGPAVDVAFVDLSVIDGVVLASGQRTLTDTNTLAEIQNDEELAEHINNDLILLTVDGTDLSKAESLDYMAAATAYDISSMLPVYGTQYQYVERTTSASTGNNIAQGGALYLSMTTPSLPAGDYEISWSVQGRHSNTGDDWCLRIQVNNTTNVTNPGGDGWTREEPKDAGADQRHPRMGFRVLTLTAGVKTIDLDFAENAGSTAWIYFGNLKIIRVA